MLGLEKSGTDAVLHRLRLNGVVPIIPTVDYTEALSYEQFGARVSFTVLNVSGSEKMRPLWRHCFKGKAGVIFVVDSSDRDRMLDVKFQLEQVLREEELRGRPLLVLANKQDQPDALSKSQLATALGLHMICGRAWSIEGCCTTTGSGMYEGLDWLAGAVDASQKGKDEAAVHVAAVQRQTSRRLLDDVSMPTGDATTPHLKCYGDLCSVADSESTADTELSEENRINMDEVL